LAEAEQCFGTIVVVEIQAQCQHPWISQSGRERVGCFGEGELVFHDDLVKWEYEESID
jgi:hypothetical protein